jgi:histidine ammonia-lyase
MGTIACRKARMILYNLRKILAIELLCAAQGLDIRTGANYNEEGAVSYALTPSASIQAAQAVVRRQVKHLTEDRELHLDITTAEKIIQSGELITSVEAVTGKLE